VPIVDINLELISYDEYKKMGEEEVIKRILASKNKIIIINKKLSPKEEVKLIEHAMQYTTGKEFKGIEIASITKQKEKSLGALNKIASLFLKKEEGLTLVGNAALIKKIKHNKEGTILKI